MSTLVVWDEALLGYDLGDHPLDPVRVELTMALARALGVLDRPGVEVRKPEPADDETLLRVHRADYLHAVKAAGHDPFFRGGYGLATSDNPVFDSMHEASALVAGATLGAARSVWRGETTRAVNIGRVTATGAVACVDRDASRRVDGDVIMVVRTTETSRWLVR